MTDASHDIDSIFAFDKTRHFEEEERAKATGSNPFSFSFEVFVSWGTTSKGGIHHQQQELCSQSRMAQGGGPAEALESGYKVGAVIREVQPRVEAIYGNSDDI